jgi:endoglucanase
VRHILDPIDRTFAEEYPDFTPYPFGARQWYEVLVRHIMLAEPMVKDFGRCFEGITDDETVVALAQSFRLDHCAIREPLEALLSEAAKA